MTQSNFSLANQSGASFRAALNTALQSLATISSGSTAPTTTYQYQMWMDTSTTPALLKMRNAANSAWVTLGVWGDASLFTLFTNGTERLRVTSGGLVGIGRTPTTYALEVQGDINVTGNLRINGTAVGAIADNSLTYAKIQQASANTVLARAAATTGNLAEVSLGLSQLIGRGASGNIAPITLGTGLTMVGTALSLASGGGGRLLGAPQLFTANGSYDKTVNNPTFIIVEGRGGGGGGGASGQVSSSGARGGGGGGQGGYFLKYFLASGLSNTTAVTVGSAGSAGSGGTGSNGGNGGSTTFSTCTAGGGDGGQRGVTSDAAAGGAGGTSSGGDVNLRGAAGGYGLGVIAGVGGTGAGDGGGLGGIAGAGPAGSAASSNTGGGGGGGGTTNSTSNNGGAGGSGWVRVWEYL